MSSVVVVVSSPRSRGRRIGCGLLGAILLFLLGSPPTARADGSQGSVSVPPSATTYPQLIREAVREFRLGHYMEARSLFEHAHALHPSARTLRGMGMAAFEARAYVAATRYLRTSLTSQQKPLTNKQREQVKDVLSRAESFIALYQLELAEGQADVEVMVDSRPGVVVDGVLLLDPGAHEVVVRFADQSARRQLRVLPSEKNVLRIQFAQKQETKAGPEAPKAVTPPLLSRKPRLLGVRDTWALSTASAGAAALVTSLGLTLRTRGLRDDAGCSGTVCPTRRALRLAERSARFGNAATTTLVLGSVLAASGVALWLWPRDERSGQRQTGPVPPLGRVQGTVLPLMSETSAGVSIQGAF